MLQSHEFALLALVRRMGAAIRNAPIRQVFERYTSFQLVDFHKTLFRNKILNTVFKNQTFKSRFQKDKFYFERSSDISDRKKVFGIKIFLELLVLEKNNFYNSILVFRPLT